MFLEPPSISDFLSAVSLCTQMIQKHGMAYKAFEDSCVAVFAERYLNAYAKNVRHFCSPISYSFDYIYRIFLFLCFLITT